MVTHRNHRGDTLKKRQRRMAMTLPAETEAALWDLADALGKPAATVAAEILTEMAPQLHDLAKVSRFAQAGKGAAAKRALTHLMGNAMAQVMAEQLPLPGTKVRK